MTSLANTRSEASRGVTTVWKRNFSQRAAYRLRHVLIQVCQMIRIEPGGMTLWL